MSDALLSPAHPAHPAVAKPLYAQVRSLLLQRIRNNEWAAGVSLPNELALASQYNVSIGTVRRAVEGLEKAGILVRRQGRGTFIARPGRGTLDDRFGRLRLISGAPLPAEYRLRSLVEREATREERARLGLLTQTQVVEFSHTVVGRSAVCGIETGVTGAGAIAGTEARLDLDRHPYAIYASLGIMVTRVEEVLAAVPADMTTAALLGVPDRTPLLHLTRTAYTLDDSPVEHRTAHYLTTEAAYACRAGSSHAA